MKGDLLNRLFWGAVLIGIGIVFLLNLVAGVSFDLGDLISDYWPVILIFYGAKGMFFQRGSETGGFFWGAILFVLGIFFLGRNLDFIHFSNGELFKYILPVMLIAFGLHLILKPNTKRKPKKEKTDPWGMETPPPPPPPNWNSEDWLGSQTNPGSDAASKSSSGWHGPTHHQDSKEETHSWHDWHDPNEKVIHRAGFIGDVHLGHDYWELKPMNISHFIGDTILDLTKAHIPYGETKLTISSFIGDVKVYVPNDYDLGVTVSSSSFLGDVRVFNQSESGFFRTASASTPTYHEADKKIKIVVSTFIGDVRVTKVG
jgi:lia operon protein LiaF